jgi:hypothetical protein
MHRDIAGASRGDGVGKDTPEDQLENIGSPEPLNLLTLPPDVRMLIYEFIPFREVYGAIALSHPNLRTDLPDLHFVEADPLHSVSEPDGCNDLQEYFRLPSMSRLVISFRWKDQG